MMPACSLRSRQSRSSAAPYLRANSAKALGLIFSAYNPLRHSAGLHSKHPFRFLSMQHLRTSHHWASLHHDSSIKPSRLHPLQATFSEHKQHASPQRAIPSSLLIIKCLPSDRSSSYLHIDAGPGTYGHFTLSSTILPKPYSLVAMPCSIIILEYTQIDS